MVTIGGGESTFNNSQTDQFSAHAEEDTIAPWK